MGLKNKDIPIAPITLRQIGDNSFRIACEKDLKEGQFLSSHLGLSKREYFAGLAMQALISKWGVDEHIDECSRRAVQASDSILKELEK